jgi:dipeptidyl aminopeptidase/acylaminoacyl peptidase
MASERQRFDVDDLYQLDWLEQPAVSPDGRFVAYVHVSVDKGRNAYRRAIWLAPTDPAAGRPRRFTAGGKSDSCPRWSHDGQRLAFVSNRDDDKGQVYVISVSGGEAQQLTRLPNGASEPAWSYDGAQLACLGRASEPERAAEAEPPPPPADDWEARRLKEQRERDDQQRLDPRVITRLPYRTGTGFFDDRRTHIYVFDVPAGDIASPSAGRRVTDGDIHFSAPAWMPDGSALLSTATRDPEADSLFAYYDVLRVPLDGSPPKTLTEAGHSYFNPRPSPDGQRIAFTRLPEDRLWTAGARVAVIPADGGPPHDLTDLTDLSVEGFAWLPDSQHLAFGACWQGNKSVYQVGVDGGRVAREGRPLVEGARFIAEFDVGQRGDVAFVSGDADSPCELFYRTPEGEERRLTNLGAELLDARTRAPFTELRFTAPDGANVQGWVLYPPDFDPAISRDGSPSRLYPLAVFIHGGPHLMWGPGSRSMWHEWQAAAARGYVVFFCNPRGGEGYGELWRSALYRAWGEADMPDIMAGIDAVIARGGVDPSRIAVTGGSYGGYMTAWLIGHSDRFCCAVAARGVYNLLTEHSTSDAHELIELEFGGYPWELHEELWDHSPLAHAHKIDTPLLILHSELDYRVPVSEAEQLFSFLRRRKKTVELVRYPREGHELTRSGEPRHRADHMRRTLEWFDRFCKPAESDRITE